MTENNETQYPKPSFPAPPEERWKEYDNGHAIAKCTIRQAERRIREAKVHFVSEQEAPTWAEGIHEAEQKRKSARYRIDNAECAAGLVRERGRVEYLDYAILELQAASNFISDIESWV
jgi:polysaccharide pyruvyl transferase WcaK-like protein